MEKLMKPAEYAQELGISRQAVYAKIKRGILTAKNVEGKLYIVVDKIKKEEATHHPKETTVKSKTTSPSKADISGSQNDVAHYKVLLEAKDETISVLKGTVKDLKKSNKQISTTLKGEIDLIKEAFHEMRALYMHQLEYQNAEKVETIEVTSEEDTVEVEEERWISVKKFFKQYKINKTKLQGKIEKRLKKAYKSGDERVMKVEDKLKVNANRTYEDIVN
jgi:hypothetical protein